MYIRIGVIMVVVAVALRLYALVSNIWIGILGYMGNSYTLFVVECVLLIIGCGLLFWASRYNKRWGIVFDEQSHEPIDLALVTV